MKNDEGRHHNDCIKDGNKVKVSTAKGYFQGHQCFLPSDKLTEYEIKCSKTRKFFLDITSADERDLRTKFLYRSFAALCAARYHQYRYFSMSIHPFSIFRRWMDILTIISLLVSNATIGICFSHWTPTIQKYFSTLLSVTDVIYIINIVTNCFTGYVEGNTSRFVVLEFNKIIVRYLSVWLIPDLVSISGLLFNNNHHSPATNVILISTKLLRFPTLYKYVKHLLMMKEAKCNDISILMAMMVVTYLLWNMFFQFAVEYYVEDSYNPISPRKCSWIYIKRIWNGSMHIKVLSSLDRSVAMLRENANMNLIKRNVCSEIYLIIFWIIAKIVTLHCGIVYIITLIGEESAPAKYFMMAQQVKTYMDQRRFPPYLKKKIMKFYSLRFQSNFFVESRMIACVSGQLRKDIMMHTGRQLVNHVAFLKQLPRTLVLQIGFKLKTVIFIAGDIIFKINTIGDCLYFIDRGTVAIYSESGKEVCHLEDGDYFGEIALVMKHRFRTATVVAVTDCELFRLDRDDFERSVACYPTVYEDIKKVAISRFERTNVLDEHQKSVMKMWEEDNTKRKNSDIP